MLDSLKLTTSSSYSNTLQPHSLPLQIIDKELAKQKQRNNKIINNNKQGRFGATTQQERAGTAFTDDPSLIPREHIKQEDHSHL